MDEQDFHENQAFSMDSAIYLLLKAAKTMCWAAGTAQEGPPWGEDEEGLGVRACHGASRFLRIALFS